MGKMLGSHNMEGDLDRPDLNKCPDCGCFFAQENCPLCGKKCTDDMRAGNRKPVKERRYRRNGSNRVTFMEWYHSWWFIILMLFIFPIAGVILLAMSPHKRSIKIAVITAAILYSILSGFGIGNIVQSISNIWNKPVNTSLSQEEYAAICTEIDAETLYRSAESYKKEEICVRLVIVEKITDVNGYNNNDKYSTYYICHDTEEKEIKILLRDCQIGSKQNFVPGDVLLVYGNGAGNCTVTDLAYNVHTAPCVNMAYAILEN